MMVRGQTFVMISRLIFAHSSLLPREREVSTNDVIKNPMVNKPDTIRGIFLDHPKDESVEDVELIGSSIYPWKSFLFPILIGCQ